MHSARHSITFRIPIFIEKSVSVFGRCHRRLSGDALVIENEQLGAVELVKNGKDNPIITVSFNAPLVGLWSPPKKNAPFVCIEPWYGRCDSENFAGDLQERDHEELLDPGKEFQTEYNIIFG